MKYNPNKIYIVCDGSSYYGVYGCDVEMEITYNDVETNINNNQFTTEILPISAGIYSLTITYSGNKYYNSKTYTIDIELNKTTDYIFTVNYDNEIYYNVPMIFTPSLEDGEYSDAEHTYTGTIQYTFSHPSFIATTNLEPYTYTPTKTGEDTVTIIYSGDSNHEARVITKTFTVIGMLPSLILMVPQMDMIYRSDIDYKTSNIRYTGNDEGLTVKVYDNDVEKYNQTGIENDNYIFNITTPGQHIITLKTDETDRYRSLTLEAEMQAYDIVEETYEILQNILNNTE